MVPFSKSDHSVLRGMQHAKDGLCRVVASFNELVQKVQLLNADIVADSFIDNKQIKSGILPDQFYNLSSIDESGT